MTRVALFGGSFNPPHVAHQLVALYVLETQPIDELWFVPVYEHVFGKELAPYANRVTMCELAAQAIPRAKVSRAEEVLAKRPEFAVSRTLDLIQHLIATQPGIEPRLVVGADILGETHKWHRWDDVIAAAPLIVVGRSGYAPPGSAVTGVSMPEISSTEIRAELAALTPADRALLGHPTAAGGSGVSGRIGSLLPGSVLRYIATRNLYLPAP